MKIPSEIGMLKKLSSVDFSNNYLTSLDFPNPTCSKLRHVYVNAKNITVLKKGSLDCFTNLQTLNITNNQLRLIENGAFNKNLNSFRNLYAPYNELVSIDSSVVSMLKENARIVINVAYNNIAILTNSANMTADDFKNKRFHLDLLNNSITRLNFTYYKQAFRITSISQFKNLWNCSIDVRFNPLICDCSMYKVATLLKLFWKQMDLHNPVFAITCNSPPKLHGTKLVEVNAIDFNCTVAEQCPPGCSCMETIFLELLTVTCDGSDTSLPDEVPAQFKTINIHIKNTPLQVLEPRTYLNNVKVLDVSQNKIKSIHPLVVPYLNTSRTVLLNDNLLSYLPNTFKSMDFTNLTTLALDGNPFKCDCHSLWMKTWLHDHKNHIPNQDKILCPSGIPLTETKDTNFLCSEPFSFDVVLSIAFGASLLLIIIGLMVRLNWTYIQVLLIANFNIHCFRKKVRTNMKYDIFLSHSSHDDDIVFQELIPRLENNDPPFRICRDDRDFIVGRTIAYNVISNIESSITTLLVISNNFLRSEWCKMEFKQAHMKLLQDKSSNLIMIILEDLDAGLMDKELTYYVRTRVYLKVSDKYFWAKLFQALPIRQQVSDTSSIPYIAPTASDDNTLDSQTNHHHGNERHVTETTPLLL